MVLKKKVLGKGVAGWKGFLRLKEIVRNDSGLLSAKNQTLQEFNLYLLIVGKTVYLVKSHFRNPRLFRIQSRLLIVAAIMLLQLIHVSHDKKF